MEVFSIGTAQPMAAVRADLEHEMDLLHRQGLTVRLLKKDRGVYSFIDCQFDQEAAGDRENQARILRYYIANIITDLILNAVTKEMLQQMLRGNYGYFTEEERGAIVSEAMAFLIAQAGTDGIPRQVFRRNQILAKVLKYLEQHHQMVLEGFLRFQLKDYFAELKDAAGHAVDRFMVEREYREFISLLRYLVEIQSPRIEEVNVRVESGTIFSLLDEEGLPIEHEQLRSILTDLGPEEIDYEDLLLSALITIAPARVILHVVDPLEVIDTIKQIFGERAVICPGCLTCRSGIDLRS